MRASRRERGLWSVFGGSTIAIRDLRSLFTASLDTDCDATAADSQRRLERFAQARTIVGIEAQAILNDFEHDCRCERRLLAFALRRLLHRQRSRATCRWQNPRVSLRLQQRHDFRLR